MTKQEYEDQIRNLEIMLIAAIRSSGGRMVISDDEILNVGDHDEIKRCNDAKNRCVVLESNTNISGQRS